MYTGKKRPYSSRTGQLPVYYIHVWKRNCSYTPCQPEYFSSKTFSLSIPFSLSYKQFWTKLGIHHVHCRYIIKLLISCLLSLIQCLNCTYLWQQWFRHIWFIHKFLVLFNHWISIKLLGIVKGTFWRQSSCSLLRSPTLPLIAEGHWSS